MKKQFKLHTILFSSLISLSALTAPLQIAHASTFIENEIEEEGEVTSPIVNSGSNILQQETIVRPPLTIRNSTTDTLYFSFENDTDIDETGDFFYEWSMDGKEESPSYKTIEVKDFLPEDYRYGILTVIRNGSKIFSHTIDSSGTFALSSTGRTYYNLDSNKTDRSLTAPQWIVDQKKKFLTEMTVAERAKENLIKQWNALTNNERRIITKSNKGFIKLTNSELEIKFGIDLPSSLNFFNFRAPYELNDSMIFRDIQSEDLLKKIKYLRPSNLKIRLTELELFNADVLIFSCFNELM